MKFEFEPITRQLIERRVWEEQRRDPNKRNVVRVVLTHKEWAEFMMNERPPFTAHENGHVFHTFAKPLYAVDPYDSILPHTWKVEITREP